MHIDGKRINDERYINLNQLYDWVKEAHSIQESRLPSYLAKDNSSLEYHNGVIDTFVSIELALQHLKDR